jgi:hypothetical protein
MPAPTARPLLALVVLAGVAACQAADQSGEVRAWAWSYDEAARSYSMKVETLPRLESLRGLRGQFLDFRRASSISVELTASTAAPKVALGRPFELEYSIDDAGVVVPADLDSFQAASLYRFIDLAVSRLAPVGYVPARPFNVLFMPSYGNFLLGDQRLGLNDNAAYSWHGRGFVIVPTYLLGQLPMLLNFGVISHEFGHAVIHETMFGDVESVPFETSQVPPEVVAYRHLRCMHEGVADLFGLVMTGDPDFIHLTVDANRNLAEPRTMTQEDFNAIDTPPRADSLDAVLPVDVHFHGSTMARAVFEAFPGPLAGPDSQAARDRLLRLTMEALRKLKYDATGAFTLASFPNELASLLTADERARACAVFKERMLPLSPRFTACP